jgi:hypothetical protein
MASGDQNDIVNRLRQVLPPWFGSSSPIVDGILYGYAAISAFLYSLYDYARQQIRIKTASEGWLDLIAADFFGTSLQRLDGQTDDSYRSRIIANLFRERATRRGLINVLTELTGRVPDVFEPRNPADTGGWGMPQSGWGVGTFRVGAIDTPMQTFVRAFRPHFSGIPNVTGWGQPAGGWGVGQAKWSDLDEIIGFLRDADIYAAVDAVKPAATIVWVRIES